MHVVAPPASAGVVRRIGGILIFLALVVALILLGFGIVQLVALPFGGIGVGVSFFWGFLLVAVVLVVLVVLGRRRQKRARERAASQRATLR